MAQNVVFHVCATAAGVSGEIWLVRMDVLFVGAPNSQQCNFVPSYSMKIHASQLQTNVTNIINSHTVSFIT
jgi:hypothetical protein